MKIAMSKDTSNSAHRASQKIVDESAPPPHIYDCVGVGFGPSNIALAIALKERGLLGNTLFVESCDRILWQPGMLIPGTDIQHNPLRDLVTPRNPTSEYGFLSYLNSVGRLFKFLNLSDHYPPRTEYAGYVEWVGNQFLSNVSLSTKATSIMYVKIDGNTYFKIDAEAGNSIYAKTLSFGPGRSNNIPKEFEEHQSDDIIHLTDYLYAKKKWCNTSASNGIVVTVVGGSQSAAEIVLDLVNTNCVRKIYCVNRSFGFKQKDLSGFTEEIYFPEFTDYFHSLHTATQNQITNELWRSNYGAADTDVIDALNVCLYEQCITKTDKLTIQRNYGVELVDSSDERRYQLLLRERNTGETSTIICDKVILATGFKNFGTGDSKEPLHPLLSSLSAYVVFRSDGGIAVDRNYRMQTSSEAHLPPLYINGLCEASHGFGDAGSFSLLSIRSDTIANEIDNALSQRSLDETPIAGPARDLRTDTV